MSGLIYLSSPWSHPDPAVRHQRYLAACKAAGDLMRSGAIVFAPIPHSVAIEGQFADGFVGDHNFWMAQDLAILGRCSDLAVLTLDGWEASKGVAIELDFARQAGIPIRFIEP